MTPKIPTRNLEEESQWNRLFMTVMEGVTQSSIPPMMTYEREAKRLAAEAEERKRLAAQDARNVEAEIGRSWGFTNESSRGVDSILAELAGGEA